MGHEDDNEEWKLKKVLDHTNSPFSAILDSVWPTFHSQFALLIVFEHCVCMYTRVLSIFQTNKLFLWDPRNCREASSQERHCNGPLVNNYSYIFISSSRVNKPCSVACRVKVASWRPCTAKQTCFWTTWTLFICFDMILKQDVINIYIHMETRGSFMYNRQGAVITQNWGRVPICAAFWSLRVESPLPRGGGASTRNGNRCVRWRLMDVLTALLVSESVFPLLTSLRRRRRLWCLPHVRARMQPPVTEAWSFHRGQRVLSQQTFQITLQNKNLYYYFLT